LAARLHLNLWRFDGTPAGDQEVVFRDFVFRPEGAVSAVGEDPQDRLPAVAAGRLLPAAPNPFNPRTTVRFELARGGRTEIAVHDLMGRRVRILVSADLEAGAHGTSWNGLDQAGRQVASGVYLIVLRGEDYLESRRVTLLK